MLAIILSAGRPAFTKQPLPAVEIFGSDLLSVQIEALHSVGVTRVTTVVGYGSDQIAPGEHTIIENPKWAEGGSLSSLRMVENVFDGSGDVLIQYGDCLYTPASITHLLNAPGDVAALCLLDGLGEVEDATEIARFADGVLAGMGGSANGGELSAVFTGLVLVRQRKASIIRRLLTHGTAGRDAHLGDLLRMVAEAGLDVAPVISRSGWIEIDSAEDLTAAEGFIRDSGITVPLRTDWSSRAIAYDKLDWVRDDELLNTMVKRASSFRPKRILDVGTGTGKVLNGLRHSGIGEEYWGIDTSQDMLDRVHEPDAYTLMVDSAETLLSIPRDHFDLVTARMVYHHIESPLVAAQMARNVLREGGRVIICEGVPPSSRTVGWYTEMFKYKEDRNTLTEGDIISILSRTGFSDIRVDVVTMLNASLNNWLDNSGIPESNIRTIKQMHYDAPSYVKEDYDMSFPEGDCLMTWRFAIVSALRS